MLSGMFASSSVLSIAPSNVDSTSGKLNSGAASDRGGAEAGSIGVVPVFAGVVEANRIPTPFCKIKPAVLTGRAIDSLVHDAQGAVMGVLALCGTFCTAAENLQSQPSQNRKGG